jgi:hypothetical protein
VVRKERKRAIFNFSETRVKNADNSFRNGKFHVPIQSETRPERGRNGSEIGTPEGSSYSGRYL